MSEDKSWKTPNEIIRLQRLKQKQRLKALQARVELPSLNTKQSSFNPFATGSHEKRRNPFLDDRVTADTKKSRKSEPNVSDLSSEDSVFNLLANVSAIGPAQSKKPLSTKEANTFLNLIKQEVSENDSDTDDNKEEKPTSHVPVDWSLKTRLRLLSKSPISGIRLTSVEEASGITNFVRCADMKSSDSAQFHQSTMYWQHPHLPWLTLFPRSAKNDSKFSLGDTERDALAREWSDSFRALFQLVRSWQCPYFYVCANSFTVLFRAAGIGGRVSTHALLTPTSRGLRAALKQEDIEFTMPLKRTKPDGPNKSLDSGNDTQSNSFSNLSDDTIKNETSTDALVNTSGNGDEGLAGDDGSEDEDAEQWLASLGVEASEIRKIQMTHARRTHNTECAADLTDQSLILVEGVECQALFNFLLNAKSATAKVGRLAGIPPTLIAPVAFPGATLHNNRTKSSVVREQGIDYFSVEMSGVVLPHTLQYLCEWMRAKQDQFSITMDCSTSTIALSKATQKIIDDVNKENVNEGGETVFAREYLSNCGLPSNILQSLCRNKNDAVRSLERMYYDKAAGGYIWVERN